MPETTLNKVITCANATDAGTGAEGAETIFLGCLTWIIWINRDLLITEDSTIRF
jgi:hypothetical protein